ncbi:hypothetical protein MSAN_01248300 [Mycena sanguinolenta]|uniref:Uncharacterized protein n=1 Tax=Mycena sanguinolenta TaxID=230812 RepID=A0A8H6YH88_9AGAR|nr:hypothetical protein MSAN_01248300 [Mycena sanguinolenta]
MTSIGASDGESPAFVASSPPFPGSQSYCAAQTTASDNTDLVLSFGGQDRFVVPVHQYLGQREWTHGPCVRAGHKPPKLRVLLVQRSHHQGDTRMS